MSRLIHPCQILTVAAALFAVAVLVALPVRAVGGEPRPSRTIEKGRTDSPAPTVEFENDVIPVLTKMGCNAGACHGAAMGRGGFALSLYGGDPEKDFDSIVRQLQGRRINLADPASSLILQKPTERLEHGGGHVFSFDDESAQVLLNWIRGGAGNHRSRILTRIEVSPRQYVFPSLEQAAPLRSTAHYSDGTTRDVTAWTIFQPEDKSAMEFVPSTTGRPAVRLKRLGRHLMIARYLNQVVPLELIAPRMPGPIELTDFPRRNFVDDHVATSLEKLGLQPSGPIDDQAYLRRVTLDLVGRLPTIAEQQAFATNPDREQRVEALLDSDDFHIYWSHLFSKLLRVRSQPENSRGAEVYYQWISSQLEQGTGLRDIATELILAEGDSHEYGPANFYRTVGGAREQAEFVSELFMGSRMRCANCHNHPLDHWTQDDYHGLAAIFAQVEAGRVVSEKSVGEVIHPQTGAPAIAKIPGQPAMRHAGHREKHKGRIGRQEFAQWLTDPANEYFAKAMVNRLWKQLMGRGLVEPVDDFRATNPATHPELLDQLAEHFVANEYRIRPTLQLIANSATYARSCDATANNKDDQQFYSHGIRKPLEAEVLADAISYVVGVHEIYGDQPRGTRAIELVHPGVESLTLDILGRCDRQETCEGDLQTAGGLPQKLHLMNGSLLNQRIEAPGSRLHRQLTAGRAAMEIMKEFYQVALCRSMSIEEATFWGEQLNQQADSESARRQFLEDFVWSILTCNEFVNNQ